MPVSVAKSVEKPVNEWEQWVVNATRRVLLQEPAVEEPEKVETVAREAFLDILEAVPETEDLELIRLFRDTVVQTYQDLGGLYDNEGNVLTLDIQDTQPDSPFTGMLVYRYADTDEAIEDLPGRQIERPDEEREPREPEETERRPRPEPREPEPEPTPEPEPEREPEPEPQREIVEDSEIPDLLKEIKDSLDKDREGINDKLDELLEAIEEDRELKIPEELFDEIEDTLEDLDDSIQNANKEVIDEIKDELEKQSEEEKEAEATLMGHIVSAIANHGDLLFSGFEYLTNILDQRFTSLIDLQTGLGVYLKDQFFKETWEQIEKKFETNEEDWIDRIIDRQIKVQKRLQERAKEFQQSQ